MALCLAVTSGKGGTGKSTVSAGLSIAFAKAGKKVLLIDADEGLRCLDLIFGVDKDIVYDLGDILSGTDVGDALYAVPGYKDIFLIPAPARPIGINPEKFKRIIGYFEPQFDIIIVDFPAGLDFSLYSALGDSAMFINVCNPDPVSVRDAAVVCAMLPKTKTEPRLIINRFNIELIKSGAYGNIDDMIDASGIRLLGIVPLSSELQLLPVFHTLKKGGRALQSFIRIASRICGKDVRLPAPKKI